MKRLAPCAAADAFCLACSSYQLPPPFVLQQFANAVSVHGFLNPAAAPVIPLASAVFLSFTKNLQPLLPLHPQKRERAISNIRRILKVLQSLSPEEEKEAALTTLTDDWYYANGIEGLGCRLYITGSLFITLPKGLLLQCDMYRCHPETLLHYFMSLVVEETEAHDVDGAATQFLLHCASLCHAVAYN